MADDVRARSRRAWFALGLLTALVGGAGCFMQQTDDADDSGEEVNAGPDLAQALQSTLILDNGCTAAKVGPRHLVLAARCVSGKPAFAPGLTINFKTADGATQNPPNLNDPSVADAQAAVDPNAVPDAGDDDDSAVAVPVADSGTGAVGSPTATTTKKNTSRKQATIESVNIHSSYVARCTGDTCAFGAIAAADAKDIAVIILDAELVNIPTIPVDLDEVGVGDPLVMLGSGCSHFDSDTPGAMKTATTVAVPAKSVTHKGSLYAASPATATNLDATYVVTPGPGWTDQTSSKICQNDIGAPLFRGNSAVAVAGIMANYTTFDPSKIVPVTVEHTRVDSPSKTGSWLTSLGVTTTHSCRDTSSGCTKNSFDGGIPSANGTSTNGTSSGSGTTAGGTSKDGGPTDAGADTGTTTPDPNDPPQQVGEVPLGPSEDDSPPGPNDGGDVDGGTKKKKKATGGCSAAPGESAPVGSSLSLGFGLAIAAFVSRRRRRSV